MGGSKKGGGKPELDEAHFIFDESKKRTSDPVDKDSSSRNGANQKKPISKAIRMNESSKCQKKNDRKAESKNTSSSQLTSSEKKSPKKEPKTMGESTKVYKNGVKKDSRTTEVYNRRKGQKETVREKKSVHTCSSIGGYTTEKCSKKEHTKVTVSDTKIRSKGINHPGVSGNGPELKRKTKKENTPEKTRKIEQAKKVKEDKMNFKRTKRRARIAPKRTGRNGDVDFLVPGISNDNRVYFRMLDVSRSRHPCTYHGIVDRFCRQPDICSIHKRCDK